MTLTHDIVEVGDRGSDHLSVGVTLLVSADVVISAGEESHGDSVDLGHIDQVSLLFMVVPLSCELLEAVQKSVLHPVLLGHDGRALSSRLSSDRFANDISEIGANSCKSLCPVWTIKGVDAMFLEFRKSVVIVNLCRV